jgi:hypothetical protein
LDGKKLAAPAFLIAHRPWVAAQELLDLLGGTLQAFGGDPLTVKISRNGSDRLLLAQSLVAGVAGAYVKFADLNGLLDLKFVLDSEKRKLDLKR